MTKKRAKFEVAFRVIFYVTLFFVLLIGCFMLLARSEKVVLFIGTHINEVLKYDNKSLEIKGLKGTINGGLIFDFALYKDLISKEEFIFEKGKISFGVERIFDKGIIPINADFEKLLVENIVFDKTYLKEIPPYSETVCFIDIPTNFELNNVHIDKLIINVKDINESNITCHNFTILPTENDNEKSLIFNTDFLWKNSKVGIASFSGTLIQKQKKINGKTDLSIAGQRIVTELNLSRNRGGKVIVGGYISEGKINTELLSNWLGSLWQQYLPISVKGNINCLGSWLYNPSVGMMGNLNGTCEAIKINLNPFNFNIAIFSNSWNILNGNLSVTDNGSIFLGAPAAFNGKIESVFNKEDRKWDSTFECRNLNIASLSNILPMPIKLGFNIPNLSGQADFSLITVGKEPNTTLRIATNDIVTEKNGAANRLSGYAAWTVAEGFNNLEANLTIRRLNGNPNFFARFSDNKTMLPGVPLAFEYKLHGDPKMDLALVGKFITGEGQEEYIRGEASGLFKKGNGSIESTFNKLNYGGVSKLSLLDLLLAR